MKTSPRRKSTGVTRRYLAVTCVLCALAGGLAAVLVGRPIGPDGPILDLLVKTREVVAPAAVRPEESPVAVIALDPRSLDEPELARYPRVLMAPIWAAVTESVLAAGARAVGFDFLFAYNANQFSPNFDVPFLAVLAGRRGQVVLARTASRLPTAPYLAALRNDPGALGLAELQADPDGRYRRVGARYGTVRDGALPGLAAALLQRAGARPMPDEVVLAPRRHLERIPTYAAVDVLRCARQAPAALASAFRGKIVLVGTTAVEEDRRLSSGRFLKPEWTDRALLDPCGLRRLGASDPEAATVPGVFLHAAAIEAVMTGRVTSRAPVPVVAGLTAATGAAAAALALSFSPWLLGGTILAIAGLLFAAATAALVADLWLPLALPLGALISAPAVAYVVRYLAEERSRRRIQHAFSHYLSPTIVDRLVADPSTLRLGGDRREVTVMFADLSGFTALSGKVEPEVLTRLTNEYLGYIVEQVEATGGYVDKFIGDAVLAMWGAPAPDPRHAVNAVLAALAAVARIRVQRDAALARGETAFSVKVGVNSGLAVVGNVGTAKRYNYTAVGETINVASRLESVPGLYGCQVVIGPRTSELVKDDVLLRELDWIQVKGGQGPIAVFEPLCEQAKATPEQLDRSRRFADALALYRKMRFVDACAIWDALAGGGRTAAGVEGGTAEQDGPPTRMAARARELAAHPPQPPWDGVWVLTAK